MSLPELAVFDLAGTLLRDNQEVERAFREALADYDLAPERVAAEMGRPKPGAISRLIGEPEDSPLVQDLHGRFVHHMVEHYQSSAAEMPGASALLIELQRRGVKTAIDTGFSRPITQVILDRMAWPLDDSISSDEAPRGRPEPDMILILMDRQGVSDPAKVLKAGDTPVDLKQGTAAGCGWVVGLGHGTHTLDQLRSHPHTHLAGDLFELAQILGVELGFSAAP
jgi:phosphonatase-like hydrolase